jgi:hypothetical protein
MCQFHVRIHRESRWNRSGNHGAHDHVFGWIRAAFYPYTRQNTLNWGAKLEGTGHPRLACEHRLKPEEVTVWEAA